MSEDLTLPKEIRNFEKFNDSTYLDGYEKAGAFHHVATMAIKAFKVPVALIVFTEQPNSLNYAAALEAQFEENEKRKNLNSFAVTKSERHFLEYAGEEIFVLHNSLVAKGLGWSFFASVPLKAPDETCVGTICLLDRNPREFFEAEHNFLKCLASAVMEELKNQ